MTAVHESTATRVAEKDAPRVIVEESRGRREEPSAPLPAIVQPSPMSLLQISLQRGASIEEITQMTALVERWQASEARNAYNVAFSAFKAEAIHIVKRVEIKDGPLKGKKYADLSAVVEAVIPPMSKHGLSHSWKLTKSERDWLEVTCTLKHVGGHSESAFFDGPPDTGSAKNPIQARASAINYLERYTLLAVTGLAAAGEDNDGNGGRRRDQDAERTDGEQQQHEPVRGPQSRSKPPAQETPTAARPGPEPSGETSHAAAGDKEMLPGQMRILRAKLKNAGLTNVDLHAQFGKKLDGDEDAGPGDWKFSDFQKVRDWISSKGQ